MTTPAFVDMMFNERVPALANSVVRHAIGIAINRSAIVAGALRRPRRRDPDRSVLGRDSLGGTAGHRGDLAVSGGIGAPGRWMDSRCRRRPPQRLDATRVQRWPYRTSIRSRWLPARSRPSWPRSACRSPSARSTRRASSQARWTAGTSNSRSTRGTRSRIPTSAPSGGRTPPRRTATTCPAGTADPFLDAALDMLAESPCGRCRIQAAGQVAALVADDAPAVFLYTPRVSMVFRAPAPVAPMPSVGPESRATTTSPRGSSRRAAYSAGTPVGR